MDFRKECEDKIGDNITKEFKIFTLFIYQLPLMLTPGPCPTTLSAVTVTLYLLP